MQNCIVFSVFLYEWRACCTKLSHMHFGGQAAQRSNTRAVRAHTTHNQLTFTRWLEAAMCNWMVASCACNCHALSHSCQRMYVCYCVILMRCRARSVENLHGNFVTRSFQKWNFYTVSSYDEWDTDPCHKVRALTVFYKTLAAPSKIPTENYITANAIIWKDRRKNTIRNQVHSAL